MLIGKIGNRFFALGLQEFLLYNLIDTLLLPLTSIYCGPFKISRHKRNKEKPSTFKYSNTAMLRKCRFSYDSHKI